MQSPPLAVFVFCLISGCLCLENVVSTIYWDAPSVQTTCDSRNETLIVYQERSPTTCKDGSDVPWTQGVNPKARLYFCTDDGNLMYQECKANQVGAECMVNCSAPIRSPTSVECYHGIQLTVITCEASAPLFKGTYYKEVNPFGEGALTNTIEGPQACEQSFGPTGLGYGCNSTHYWTKSGCQTGCTNCPTVTYYPLAAPNSCINSKTLQCYSGYSENTTLVPVSVVTKTVNSDTVCARFDYKCHPGDTTCSGSQQALTSCKHGYTFMSSADCVQLAAANPPSSNVKCCSTNLCNAPVANAVPCVTMPPPPITIYDEGLAAGWGWFGGNVILFHTGGAYSGTYDIAITSYGATESLTITCPTAGCISRSLGWSSVSFFGSSFGSSGSVTITISYVKSGVPFTAVSFPLNSNWLHYTAPLSSNDSFDGIQFQISSGLVFGSVTGYIDKIILA